MKGGSENLPLGVKLDGSYSRLGLAEDFITDHSVDCQAACGSPGSVRTPLLEHQHWREKEGLTEQRHGHMPAL